MGTEGLGFRACGPATLSLQAQTQTFQWVPGETGTALGSNKNDVTETGARNKTRAPSVTETTIPGKPGSVNYVATLLLGTSFRSPAFATD